MEITLNKQTETLANIQISIVEGDYAPSVEKKIRDYQKKAALKGFRPGKAPLPFVKKLVGKDIKAEEVTNLLFRSLDKYIKDQKIDILGDPLPEDSLYQIDWDSMKDLNVSFEIGLVPEFEIPLSKDIVLPRYVIQTEEKHIDESIERVLKNQSKLEETDVVVAEAYLEGEIIAADQDALVGRKAIFGVSKVAESQQALFLGKKAGDEISFNSAEAFPEVAGRNIALGQMQKEEADVEGSVTVRLTNVRATTTPELDQTLFDGLFGPGEVNSIEEFRAKIREIIEKNNDDMSNSFISRKIRKHLLNQLSFDLPEAFLRKWLMKTNENLDEAQVDKEFAGFAQQLRWTIVENKIALTNGLRVSEEEIREAAEAHVEKLIAQYGISPDDEQLEYFVNEYLTSQNKKNYKAIAESIRTEKVLNFVQTQITVENSEVSLEEFESMFKAFVESDTLEHA